MLLEEFDANRQRLSIHKTLHEPIEGFPKVSSLAFQE